MICYEWPVLLSISYSRVKNECPLLSLHRKRPDAGISPPPPLMLLRIPELLFSQAPHTLLDDFHSFYGAVGENGYPPVDQPLIWWSWICHWDRAALVCIRIGSTWTWLLILNTLEIFLCELFASILESGLFHLVFFSSFKVCFISLWAVTKYSLSLCKCAQRLICLENYYRHNLSKNIPDYP